MGEVVSLNPPQVTHRTAREVQSFGRVGGLRVLLLRETTPGDERTHPLSVVVDGPVNGSEALCVFVDSPEGRARAGIMGRSVLRALELARGEWDVAGVPLAGR